DLAGNHGNLALVLRDLGRRPEAESAVRKALAIQEPLAEEFPGFPEYRRELALSHNNLGSLLRELGRLPEAEAAHRRALALREPRAEESPAVTGYRVDLGDSYINFGNLVSDGGDPRASLEWFARAARTLEGVLAQVSRDAAARLSLRNTHWSRALALQK